MALGRFSMLFRDGSLFNTSSDVYLSLPLTATLQEVHDELLGTAQAVDQATDATITGAFFHLELGLTLVKTGTPASGVHLNEALALKFANKTNSRPWDFIIPAQASSTIIGGRPDNTGGATINRLALKLSTTMTTGSLGVTGTQGQYVNNQFNQLTTPVGTFYAKRKLARKPRSASKGVAAP